MDRGLAGLAAVDPALPVRVDDLLGHLNLTFAVSDDAALTDPASQVGVAADQDALAAPWAADDDAGLPGFLRRDDQVPLAPDPTVGEVTGGLGWHDLGQERRALHLDRWRLRVGWRGWQGHDRLGAAGELSGDQPDRDTDGGGQDQ